MLKIFASKGIKKHILVNKIYTYSVFRKSDNMLKVYFNGSQFYTNIESLQSGTIYTLNCYRTSIDSPSRLKCVAFILLRAGVNNTARIIRAKIYA